MNIKNLSFSFGSNIQPFFENVSIGFKSDSINVIAGKNGVGKSTFFSIVQGTVHSKNLSGTLEFDGTSYNLNNPQAHALIKTVQQGVDIMLAHSFTVQENLQLAMLPRIPSLHTLPAITIDQTVLNRCNINLQQPVSHLSGGQRQILAILMMLQKPTKILLLDEPTASLDDANANMVITFLEQLAQRHSITILMICHDTSLLEQYKQFPRYEIKQTDKGQRIITPKQ